MAGMRAVHKKNGTTFKYSGDLKETIEKAEKELKEKEGTTQSQTGRFERFHKTGKRRTCKKRGGSRTWARQYKSLNYSGELVRLDVP